MISSDKNQTYTKRALFLSCLWTLLNKHEMLEMWQPFCNHEGKQKRLAENYSARLKHVFYGKNGAGKKRK